MRMRNFLSALGVGTFLFASTALATPTCLSLVGQPAADCTAGPLTFSNFSATSFNVANAALFIGGATSDTNSVTVQFNPMIGVSNNNQDVWLQYGVTSTEPITGITTANGGNPAMGNVASSSIATWVCSGSSAGPGGCGPNAANALGYVQADGGQTVSASLAGSGHSALSTFQNVNVPAGGTLGNFTQTFSFGGEFPGEMGSGGPSAGSAGGSSPSDASVPEPMSFMLIGSGLLALGLLRRKGA
jgi:hypothetical protein